MKDKTDQKKHISLEKSPIYDIYLAIRILYPFSNMKRFDA
jgi:hypothetical protein